MSRRLSYRHRMDGGTDAHFGDAVTLEQAVEAGKHIKRRRAVEREKEREAEKKARITLSTSLDAWLKKEV